MKTITTSAAAALACMAGLAMGPESMAQNISNAVKMEGVHAMAISQAIPVFRQKNPEGDIADYRIVLREDDKGYKVVFVPKLAEDEKPTPGGQTSLGRELNVWISPNNFSVIESAYAE